MSVFQFPVRDLDLANAEAAEPLLTNPDPIQHTALVDMKNPVVIAKPGENTHPYELYDVLRILESPHAARRTGPLTRTPFTIEDVHPIRIRDSRGGAPERIQLAFDQTVSAMLAIFVRRDDLLRIEGLVLGLGVRLQCLLTDVATGKKMTPLHIALVARCARSARWLIRHELEHFPPPAVEDGGTPPPSTRINLEVADSDGMSPFLLAVATGMSLVVEQLFEQLDAMPEDRQRALFRSRRLAREVLFQQTDASGAGAVAIAVRERNSAMLEVLKAIQAPLGPFPLTRQLGLSRCPFISVIEHAAPPNLLRLLTQMGANPCDARRGRLSAMAVAAQYGHLGHVYMLLRLGLRPDEEAFVEAASANHVEVLRALAHPTWILSSYLRDVVDNDLGRVGVAPFLPSSEPQGRPLVHMLTRALTAAVEQNSYQAAEALLRMGADATDALMHAVQEAQLWFLEAFSHLGSTLPTPMSMVLSATPPPMTIARRMMDRMDWGRCAVATGQTPLTLAVFLERTDAIRLLLCNGRLPTRLVREPVYGFVTAGSRISRPPQQRKCTALDMALTRRSNTEAVSMLRSAMLMIAPSSSSASPDGLLSKKRALLLDDDDAGPLSRDNKRACSDSPPRIAAE